MVVDEVGDEKVGGALGIGVLGLLVDIHYFCEALWTSYLGTEY